ncbi:MAG: cation-translocating P-type ATPase [Pseudoflavonifractor sp.]
MSWIKKGTGPIAPGDLPVLETDPARGLTGPEVAARLAAGLHNAPVEAPTKTEGRIIRDNICTFFNLIFLVLGLCLALVGSFHNMLFLGIAIANTAIGIVQEIRSKRVIDKLTLLSAPRAQVLRDGVQIGIPTEDLVRDDIVLLAAGNQISADGVVCTGELLVSEALLTGEQDAILKKPGDGLLSGSFVLAGTCRARLQQVGASSFAARLTLEAKKSHPPEKSEMMRSMNKLIRFIGILLVPMGLALFAKQFYVLNQPLISSVSSTVAALIGMIPEGLYLLTSVALAVSVVRLARKKTLVHEMGCIETLARVDLLCVDKTGTITEPGMQVAGLCPLGTHAAQELETILGAFYAAAGADNETAKALQRRFSAPSDWGAEQVLPFTSANKWSAADFGDKGKYVVGAPEFVLGPDYAPLRAQVEEFSAQGERVLLLARLEGSMDGGKLRGSLEPLALLRLANQIRETAPETFRYFAAQGVGIKVISGDSALTVSQVARRAGIADAENYVDAAQLKTDEDLTRAATEYTVFGRVTPDQKRKIIRALQSAGHIVAMTGDGVNDVLALKDANVGIAMASGSEAACQAAQLVLLSSDFSALPAVVLEGRRVINNIQRASSLFLVKNIFSFFLAAVTIFFTAMPYPLHPLQMSLVGALTIGIPSFFLALEPNKALVQGRFLHNVLKKACPGGFTNLLLVLGVEVCAYTLGFTTEELSTLAMLLVAGNGLLVLYRVCLPFDRKRALLWWAMAGAMVGAIFCLGNLFSLVPLTLRTGAVLVLGLLLAVPCQSLILRVMNGCSALRKRRP